MRTILMLLSLALTGCLASSSQGRSTTEYVHDDGVHPVQRTSVTQTASGSTFGGMHMPVVMAGGGSGGVAGFPGQVNGMMSGNGAACAMHPDYCAVVMVASVPYQPTAGSPSVSASSMSVGGVGGSGTSMVGPGSAGTYGPSRADPQLEARIRRVEELASKLKGVQKLSLRQNCQLLLKEPDAIEDEAERASVVEQCKKILKKPETTDTAESAEEK